MIEQIDNWFSECKPKPTEDDVYVQLAVVIEEFRELLYSFHDMPSPATLRLPHIQALHHLGLLEAALKRGVKMGVEDRVQVLDALCDITVTCIGLANFLGMDFQSALQEVADSNDSKLEDGQPVFDENGKMAKGKDYFAPKLEAFA